MTLLIPLEAVRNKRAKVPLRCECGAEFEKRPTDIITGKQIECSKCASSRRAKQIASTEAGKKHLLAAAKIRAVQNKKSDSWNRLRRTCQAVAYRCNNPRSNSYANYGGRGVKFMFESASDMAIWLLNNLGARPEGASIDRIDNDGNYEPGNLRWATKAQQANNKRQYRGAVYGGRIKRLLQLRSDLTYETIRTWIKQGLTDEQIISRPKSTSGRPRIRHS
jgi:hypothetical protein